MEDDDFGVSYGSGNDNEGIEMVDVNVAPRAPSAHAPRATRAKWTAIVDDAFDFDEDEEDFFQFPARLRPQCRPKCILFGVPDFECQADGDVEVGCHLPC